MADIPPPPPSNTPPPPPSNGPQPYLPPPPAGYQQPPAPPPGSPGYMPQGIGPTSGSGLGVQFLAARSSIIVGVIGIVVPIVSAFIFTGSVFYFYILPVFGFIYGVRAMMRGFVIGGGVGVVLNILAGIISLTAAGIINPG